jgi:hypothetical protein
MFSMHESLQVSINKVHLYFTESVNVDRAGNYLEWNLQILMMYKIIYTKRRIHFRVMSVVNNHDAVSFEGHT